MDSLLLAIFLLLAVTSAHAAIQNATSAQTYWQTMLPNTPIPASIQEVLRQAKEMNSFQIERSPTVFISYKSAAQIHNDPNIPLFFLKTSLKSGTKKTLDLTKIISTPPFFSVEKSKATPFSSSKLSEILTIFNIQRASAEAISIQRTLAECEEPPLDGERKRCVTSMEAMVEFIKAELSNKNVLVVETTVTGGAAQGLPKQEYVVGLNGAHRVVSVKHQALVSCHPEPYPRAVYYCHTTSNIEVYKVRLVGENGVAVDAVATCHTNTSTWDPNYMGFKMLKVKPGTEPICHFLPLGHLIFVGLSKKDSFAV